MQIVVADDNPGQRLYLSKVLGELNHDVQTTENGADALDALERGEASILLTDIDMPEMDGLELVRRVRENPLDRYVYAIVFTGLGSEERNRALEAGADEFVTKPLDPASLTARLRSAQRLLTYERDLRAKNRQLLDDLAAAAEAQQVLLPEPEMVIGSCRFSSVFLPSRTVSGDVFGFFPVGNGRVAFFAADVSGHGVRAALAAVALGYMASEEFFANMAVSRDGVLQPERVAQVLNARFLRDGADNYFTMFVGVIDERTETLAFCQAGYPSPLLMRADGCADFLGEGGMPVALLPDAQYERRSVRFSPGDRLVVYSDGVSEATDRSDAQFSGERLAACMTNARSQAPQAALAELTRQVRIWRQGAPLDDDVSLIIIDREEGS